MRTTRSSAEVRAESSDFGAGTVIHSRSWGNLRRDGPSLGLTLLQKITSVDGDAMTRGLQATSRRSKIPQTPPAAARSQPLAMGSSPQGSAGKAVA